VKDTKAGYWHSQQPVFGFGYPLTGIATVREQSHPLNTGERYKSKILAQPATGFWVWLSPNWDRDRQGAISDISKVMVKRVPGAASNRFLGLVTP
jgi:hypothetical protein